VTAAGHALRLLHDRLDPGARLMLPALNRVLYVLEGAVSLDGADLHANGAWHGAGACTATAGARGATVLRYELVGPGAPAPAGVVVLEHAIRLDPAAAYLMRCDRVDFDRGGEALPHRHKGGGIRCLIAGGMELRIEGEPDRTVKPGQALVAGERFGHIRFGSRTDLYLPVGARLLVAPGQRR